MAKNRVTLLTLFHVITAGLTVHLSTLSLGSQAAECTPLKPQVSSGTGNTIKDTIGPTLGFRSHGNSYFLIERPVKTITVTLAPLTTDSASYPTQLVSRYNDDTIYESGAPVFNPATTQPIIWGPLQVNQTGKELVVFNVKILENFHRYIEAKGSSYSLSAVGCQ